VTYFLQPILENIPDEIKLRPQFVFWKAEKRDGKMTKTPRKPGGGYAKSNDSLTWSSFDACRHSAKEFDGIGFVLTDDDPYIGLDFDKCYCPAADLIDPVIEQHVKNLNSYTEKSPGGRGIRVLVKGSLPVAGQKNGSCEIYSSGRYVTLTGHILPGYPRTIENRQAEIDRFRKEVFSDKNTEKSEHEKHPSENVRNCIQTDQSFIPNDRLKKALESKSGAEIQRLLDGDFSNYPSQSEGDLALCNHLAFWFNGDEAAIDATFRESKRYRPKWDEKHYGNGETYGQHTIGLAVKGCKNFYSEINADEDVTKVTKVTFDYDKNIIPETDFPFKVFNNDFLQIVNISSKAIHIEPEIAAAVMIAIVSGAVGNTVRVSPKKGYTVPLFIWLIVIATSGYGKSPLMNLLMRHIKQLQSKAYMEYEKKLKEYEKALRDAKNDNTVLIPDMPHLRHYEVADNTVEALTSIFKQDPRGTISDPDEIASLIQGLNQYKGKGNDREQYLSFFNCESIKVDRKGKTTFAPNTGLAIIGGIQPKKMPGIFDDDSFDEGFIARYLTINGNANSIEFSREFVTDETIQYWIALINYCYSIPLELDENGFVKFKTLILSEDAIEAYIHFYNDYGKKILFLTERARVFIPKLIAYYCLKFAGILHVLNCYHANISSNAIPQLIDIEMMNHAIALTKYFAGQVIKTIMLYDKKGSLNEFQEVLIQVLYDLRGDVTGGKILLSRIVEVYNSRIPSEMTPHAVSAMLRDFGLITEKKGLNLSYLLWEPTKIQKLLSRKKVTNVTNITQKDHKQKTDVTFDTFVTLNQENKDTKKVNSEVIEVLEVLE
jgi:hypothetical protein